MKNAMIVLLLVFAIGCAHRDAAKVIPEDAAGDAANVVKPVRLTEFTLGPGDTIEVFVWRYPELSRKIQIDPSGRFDYPFLGEVNTTGMSVAKLHDLIQSGLSTYIVNPTVSVSIVSIKSEKVYVVGEVLTPGAFDIDAPMSALEAVSRAGGFTKDAKRNSAMLIRKGRNNAEPVRLDMARLLESGGVSGQNVMLRPGDIIYVPTTYIADVSRFASYVRDILAPILMIEQGVVLAPQVRDALRGESPGQTNVFVNP